MERPVAMGSDEKWERGKKSSERLSGTPPPGPGSGQLPGTRCEVSVSRPLSRDVRGADRPPRHAVSHGPVGVNMFKLIFSVACERTSLQPNDICSDNVFLSPILSH